MNVRVAPWLGFGLGLLLASTALAAAFPGVLRIPRPAGGPAVPPPAAFSHRVHQSHGCFACHPSVFPQGPLSFTHEDMRQGRFCGHCHDGQAASAIAGTACGRCHVEDR